jgi:hypothetical protein
MTGPSALARFVVCLALWGLAASPAPATSLVVSQELPALVEESRRGVLAEVVRVRYGMDERNLHSTWVTLRIEDLVYGEGLEGREELTIKVYGAPMTMPDGTRLFIDGTPLYRVGDRYFLLLRQDSDWGFTNTAGLAQGAFLVREERGHLRARSLTGNRGVFGEQGLARFLDEEELTPQERLTIADPAAAVPFPLLRRAVLQVWTGLGRRVPDPAELEGGAR